MEPQTNKMQSISPRQALGGIEVRKSTSRRPGRPGIVGGPVTSVETVGVLPVVGGIVMTVEALRGSGLQISVY